MSYVGRSYNGTSVCEVCLGGILHKTIWQFTTTRLHKNNKKVEVPNLYIHKITCAFHCF